MDEASGTGAAIGEGRKTSPALPRNPLTAGGWSGISFLAASLIATLLYIPLARRLAPEDFGVFTEANLVYLGLVLLCETAVVQALVQAGGGRATMAQAGLWLSGGLGVAGTALCLAAAPLMVAIYGDRLLIPLLVLMAPGVLASSLGATPHALLTRELDFRRKTLPETLSVGVSGAAALGAAFAGLGVYSLALMAVVQAVVSTVTAWWVTGLRPQLSPPDKASLRRLISKAVAFGAGDLALYARLNTDYALTGRLVGTAPLGIYTLAWATSAGPFLVINAFTGRIGFALFSRLQHDREHLKAVFLSGLRLVATVALPVFLGAVVVTPDLVPVLFDERWRPVIAPAMVLFVLQALRIIAVPAASLVLALGYGRLYAAVNAIGLPFTVLAVLVGARGGVTGVAWAMLIAIGTVSLVYLVIAARLLRIHRWEFVTVFAIPVLLTAVAVLATAAARFLLLSQWETLAVVRLTLAVSVGLAVFLALAWRLWPLLRNDLGRLRRALPEEEVVLPGAAS